MKTPCRVKYVLNVDNSENNDNKCFMWSSLAKMYPVNSNPQRISNYEMYKYKLNFDGIDFPVSIPSGIKKFEK